MANAPIPANHIVQKIDTERAEGQPAPEDISVKIGAEKLRLVDEQLARESEAGNDAHDEAVALDAIHLRP